MPAKKKFEIVDVDFFPKALIIGNNQISTVLATTLKERGCQVRIIPTPTDVEHTKYSHRFDYILHFGSREKCSYICQNFLAKKGKYLLVETTADSLSQLKYDLNVKILKIGDIELWEKDKLAEIILKTLFSTVQSPILDLIPKTEKNQVKKNSDVVKIEYDHFKNPLKNEKILDHHPTDIKKLFKDRPLPARHTVNKIIIPKWIFISLFFVIFVLISAISTTYWYITSIQKTFQNFRSHLAQSNFLSVKEDLIELKKKLNLANGLYQFSYNYLLPIRQTSFMQDIGDLLDISFKMITTSEESFAFIQKFDLSQTFYKSDKTTISKTDIEQTILNIEKLTSILESARTKLADINLAYLPKDSFLIFINNTIDKLNSLHKILPLAQKLFLTDVVKTYLLLFQNNMELRPTGGFIGSLGTLTVLKGQILEFKIFDVYTADGQLKGHVDPPYPIRQHLEQPNWFLRDSNFDPDFYLSASKAEWFLQNELGTEVDGVIGVNLFFVQNLLRLTGPIVLADFDNDSITSDNFLFKAHYYTQKDFFPGSTQKKDFLTALTIVLQNKIFQDRNLAWMDIMSVIKNALDEKNILLAVRDENLQQEMEKEGWAGRMVDVKCLIQNNNKNISSFDFLQSCYPDYLSIIEANLGVNKANFFISKTLVIEKNIDSNGALITVLTLSYENKNIQEIYPGGNYKNYLRIYVPLGSKLVKVTLNNVPLTQTEVIVQNYNLDKTVFEFLVNIASQNKGVLKITYNLPRMITDDVKSYQFFYQKQGGDKTSPLLLSVTLPRNINFSPVNFKPSAGNNNEILYTTDTLVDRIFVFERKK